jgi:hypothetical protein
MSTMPQYISSSTQPLPEVVGSRERLEVRGQPVVLQRVVQKISVEFRTPEPRPKEMLLGTINRCEFRVMKPIQVHLTTDQDGVIASWEAVDEFGTGKSTSLALDDLGRTLAELYESLEAEKSQLSPYLAKVWETVQQHLARRS